MLTLLTALAGCGRALDTPESLAITDYPANTDVTLTFVMKACSDTCSTYEASTCTVNIVSDTKTLDVAVSVPYGDNPDADGVTLDGCSLRCGAPILAHCNVSSIPAGVWTVEAGTFSTSITLR